ncbi:hypothetical protein HOBO_220 [Bacillus phage Hobo]|uniref:Uncharacterized protein n=2 Tax=Caeruleovirus BM15 TaxID=1985178 RepID=A0A0S2MUS5_9CAUD|nr:hypothetical protein FD732_gp121 [Bacillus phage BM15]ALO79628.1 hypothetical protein BM10_224 [Bacillus phage BM15]AXQ66975.1 hypothetical protein HOBO_220 [Bacillus phage Hobo]
MSSVPRDMIEDHEHIAKSIEDLLWEGKPFASKRKELSKEELIRFLEGTWKDAWDSYFAGSYYMGWMSGEEVREEEDKKFEPYYDSKKNKKMLETCLQELDRELTEDMLSDIKPEPVKRYEPIIESGSYVVIDNGSPYSHKILGCVPDYENGHSYVVEDFTFPLKRENFIQIHSR